MLSAEIFSQQHPGILKIATPPEWADQALCDLGAFMSDHAWCERKASGNCLSFLAAHLAHPSLAEPMVRLAREELEHFHTVFNHMAQRNFPLRLETRNHYVRALRVRVRGEPFQLLDRLLVAAAIEARSCERLGLAADALPRLYPRETELADFYRRLTRAEARHYVEFVELASGIFGEGPTLARLDEILEIERAEILKSPWGPCVH